MDVEWVDGSVFEHNTDTYNFKDSKEIIFPISSQRSWPSKIRYASERCCCLFLSYVEQLTICPPFALIKLKLSDCTSMFTATLADESDSNLFEC